MWTARNQVIRWDEVTDFPIAPSYTSIRLETTATGAVGGAFYAVNEIELFGSTEIFDDDMDGLDDTWETANGLDPADDGTVGETVPVAKDGPNGALGDPDGDTLTNEEEFNRGTKPNEKDTDGDGLDDNIETNDGTFDDLASDTGTDPNNSDTDGDGLPDGIETNDGTNDGPTDRGTNPLLADTDNDSTSDGIEIDLGTDPLNPNSTPFSIEILGIGAGALLGGDLTDVDDVHDEVAYNPPGDFGGFDATFTASKEPGFGGGRVQLQPLRQRSGWRQCQVLLRGTTPRHYRGVRGANLSYPLHPDLFQRLPGTRPAGLVHPGLQQRCRLHPHLRTRRSDRALGSAQPGSADHTRRRDARLPVSPP